MNFSFHFYFLPNYMTDFPATQDNASSFLVLSIILSVERSVVMLRGRAGGHIRAELGREVTMGCQYRLNSDQLYSVKWYRDHNEFYRFIPTGDSI